MKTDGKPLGHKAFDRLFDRDVRELFAATIAEKETVVTDEMIQHRPPGRPISPVHRCRRPTAGTLRLGQLPVRRARNQYLNAYGHMLVTVPSLITVIDASGEAMDQGWQWTIRRPG